MEQDRLKKIEKERAEKEKAEKLAQAKLKKDLDLKEEESSLVPVKSKFVSMILWNLGQECIVGYSLRGVLVFLIFIILCIVFIMILIVEV